MKLTSDGGRNRLSFRQMMLSHFGWCPGAESASTFSVRPSIQIPGILYPILVSLLGIIMYFPQAIYAYRTKLDGYFQPRYNWIFLSIILMILSIYMIFRWMKPLYQEKILLTQKNLLLFGLVIFALSRIWIQSFDMWMYAPNSINFLNNLGFFFYRMIDISSGIVLLRLVSIYMSKTNANREKTRLTFLLLA